jgi:inorganic pyrophosphatase
MVIKLSNVDVSLQQTLGVMRSTVDRRLSTVDRAGCRARYPVSVEPGLIEVFVEIPRGSRNKYEIDKERGVLTLDRVLFSSVHYPTDYGFVIDTLAEDGDALDALVVVDEPTFPGCHVIARPIGVLDMQDEKGPDQKILAVPIGDPRFSSIHDLQDIDQHWLREIENFFQNYKQLEDKWTDVVGWEDAAAAARVIRQARQLHAHGAVGAELP